MARPRPIVMPALSMWAPATPLDMVCSECDGEGWVQSPAWERWTAKFEELRVLVEDDTGTVHTVYGVSIAALQNANGYLDADKAINEGLLEHEPEQPVCPECEGIGTVPTEAGMALLEFYWRHIQKARTL